MRFGFIPTPRRAATAGAVSRRGRRWDTDAPAGNGDRQEGKAWRNPPYWLGFFSMQVTTWPPLKMKISPVDWETVIATALVAAVMAAAL